MAFPSFAGGNTESFWPCDTSKDYFLSSFSAVFYMCELIMTQLDIQGASADLQTLFMDCCPPSTLCPIDSRWPPESQLCSSAQGRPCAMLGSSTPALWPGCSPMEKPELAYEETIGLTWMFFLFRDGFISWGPVLVHSFQSFSCFTKEGNFGPCHSIFAKSGISPLISN